MGRILICSETIIHKARSNRHRETSFSRDGAGMEIRMKKIVLLLCAAILAFLLVACAGASGGDAGTSGSEAADAAGNVSGNGDAAGSGAGSGAGNGAGDGAGDAAENGDGDGVLTAAKNGNEAGDEAKNGTGNAAADAAGSGPGGGLVLPDGFWQRVDGSTATIPISEALYKLFDGKGEITHNRTYEAYLNLLSGQADLVFTLEPSPDILDLFDEAGVGLELIPIVKDAFVLFVNDENPVQSLTVDELRDIYTGAILNWKQVGGDDLWIIPYQRNEAAGSQALFLMLLMQDEKPLVPPTDYIQHSMQEIIDMVAVEARGRAAIGFNVFYHTKVMYENEHIRILKVEGVQPNRESIMSGEYPLDTYYYAAVREGTPAGHPARQLIDFVLSDEGQRLMGESGYVPVREA